MKPRQMTFFIDEKGEYWDRVHFYGYSKVPKEWIDDWKAKGIEIIVYPKPSV